MIGERFAGTEFVEFSQRLDRHAYRFENQSVHSSICSTQSGELGCGKSHLETVTSKYDSGTGQHGESAEYEAIAKLQLESGVDQEWGWGAQMHYPSFATVNAIVVA